MSLLKFFSSPQKVVASNLASFSTAATTATTAATKRVREEMTTEPDKRLRALAEPSTEITAPSNDLGVPTSSSAPPSSQVMEPNSPNRAPVIESAKEPVSNAVPTDLGLTSPPPEPSSAPPPSPVTQAQLARSEANRLAALEKRRLSEEKKNAIVDLSSVTFADMEKLFVCESWKKLLQNEFNKPYFAELKRFLVQEQRANARIFPPLRRIFHAFDVCPVENVKVVIIGQDPYHDDGQAEGMCFSVPMGVRIPSSLQNIYKELGDCIPGFKRPNHGHLGAWGAQGVFLLNTGLTVRAHEANSHNGKGWQLFTDAAIAQLSSNREGLVFFLWGKHAQDKERLVNKTKRHTIFKCAHPSGLSANRGFFGSRHFALANDCLVKQGIAPINWQV